MNSTQISNELQSPSQSLSISALSPQCQHSNLSTFLCRSQTCLSSNKFLLCSESCLPSHIDHPQQLISYEAFRLSLPTIKKQQLTIQCCISSRLRQAMNGLLQLRIAISQSIDNQIGKLKEIMLEYQVKEGEKDIDSEKIKGYVEKIQLFDKNQGRIEYDLERELKEEEARVEDEVRRMWRRLGRNVKGALAETAGIFQLDQSPEKEKKKSYEYKVDGNITKVLKLIKSTPQHVDRLKIYLNSDTYGYNFEMTKRVKIPYTVNRNYKETYESLLKCLCELPWIKKIHLSLWDNYLLKQGKLELIAEYRKQMANVESFIVDDKVKNVLHDIVVDNEG